MNVGEARMGARFVLLLFENGIRWSAKGRGTSGGVRVVYYYYNETIPLFLLTVFGKGEKSNLSKNERNELAKLTKLLGIDDEQDI